MANKVPYNETYILLVKDTGTIFYSQNFLKYENCNEEVVLNNKKYFTIYNNIDAKKYVHNDSAINTIQWKMLSDTATILGFKCNSATAFFRGKQWTAWYAPKIPCKYGPWVLSGLPGLILKVSTDSSIMVFEATGFYNGSKLLRNIKEFKKIAIQTNHYAFMKDRNFYNNNLMLFAQNNPLYKDLKKEDGTPLFKYECEKKVKLPTYFEE